MYFAHTVLHTHTYVRALSIWDNFIVQIKWSAFLQSECSQHPNMYIVGGVPRV